MRQHARDIAVQKSSVMFGIDSQARRQGHQAVVVEGYTIMAMHLGSPPRWRAGPHSAASTATMLQTDDGRQPRRADLRFRRH